MPKRRFKDYDADAAKLLSGHYHVKTHSSGETPWQYALGDYECARRAAA